MTDPRLQYPHPPRRRPAAMAQALPARDFRYWLCGLLAAGALSLAGSAEAASKIFRTVDENGNVVFTDVPPRPEQSGEAVELDSGNTFTPPPRTTPEAGASGVSLEDWLEGGDAEGAADGDENAGTARYRTLQITSPANDAAVRENAGNVTVSASIEPSLATGHVMQVFVDGQLRQQGQTSTFQLVNLDRGTHNVQVRVVDQTGSTLISSEPSVFHLQRRSVILQPGNRAN